MFYMLLSTATNRYFCRVELKLSMEFIKDAQYFRIFLNDADLKKVQTAGIQCVPCGSSTFVN